MANKSEKGMISSNGILIKGDITAFANYEKEKKIDSAKKDLEKLYDKSHKLLDEVSRISRKNKKEKKKRMKEITHLPTSKPQKREETEAERKRRIAAQKRIEQYHQKMADSRVPSHSSFKVMQKTEWILDWNYVMFKNGYIVIYAHSTSNVKFRPLKTYVHGSLESFNYLKKYLNERLPPVRCEIVQLELKIIDQINFNDAIQQFAIAARQGVIKTSGRGVGLSVGPAPMSFSQALSKAKQMTPEEFRKYKSKYIDYLVTLQSKKYKVIPCVERLAHSTGDTTEYAFMFSIECRSGKVLIVHENVNPDRSTLLFMVEEENFDKSIREIYNFLQSPEINKRSSLRDRSIDIRNAGIESYRSINHDDIDSWKSTITFYKNYR